jgi:hypothetical protein
LQETGVSRQNDCPDRVPISTPDFELRTPDFRPDTWHPIPDTCFPPPFVFIDISGCTFIFEVQETESGDRMPPTDPNFGIRLRTSNLGLRTSALTPGTWHLKPDTCFSPSFVFIDISGVTFIFVEKERGGTRRNISAE